MAEPSVLIPGLLGPLEELQDHAAALPDVKILSQSLCRADCRQDIPANYLSTLAHLLHLPNQLSASQLSATFDDIETNVHTMRADPVHFKAEMDRAVLLDQHRLGIYPEEAQALVDAFNQHFADDGLRLECSDAARWYLHFTQILDIQTTALPQAIARNVHNFLPQGEDARRWRQILNEAQMLFHAHEVNQRREAAGQLTINSLWLWGEGDDLSESKKTTSVDWIMADEPLACGLAQQLAIPLQPKQPDFSGLSGKGLLVLDQLSAPASYGDVSAWLAEIELFSQQWMPALLAALKSGQFSTLHLYSDNGTAFSLSRYSLFKFWRRGHWADFVSRETKN